MKNLRKIGKAPPRATRFRPCCYDVHGNRIVSAQTTRRREKELQRARLEEMKEYVRVAYDTFRRQQGIIAHVPIPEPTVSLHVDNQQRSVQEVPIHNSIGEMVASSDNEQNVDDSLTEQRNEIIFDDEVSVSDDDNTAALGSSDFSNSEDDTSNSDDHTSSKKSSPSASCPSPPTSCSDNNYENLINSKLEDYITAEGDKIMFTESNLKTWQVMLIILGLCIRFSLSAKSRRALIDATKLFAGPEFSSWEMSDYYFSKIFEPPEKVILYHFYCTLCCKVLELDQPITKSDFRNEEVVCDTCMKSYVLLANSPNYFVSVDLKYQIKSLLNMPIIQESVLKNVRNANDQEITSDDEVIRDVHDGILYKKLVSDTPENTILLTYVFNTDGAPLFNSSKRAFWPILLILNELPPRLRFRYPLLAGLLLVKNEPSPQLMNTYMKFFVKQSNLLSIEGFDVRINGKDVHFVLKPLVCSVDSVARPLLQNRLQFNGYYGCSWCYSIGAHTNGCIRFVMEENEPTDRTHEEYLKDVRAVNTKSAPLSCRKKNQKKETTVRGIKGTATCCELIDFDMIWAYFRDYLHADLLGVAAQMWAGWCDSHNTVHLSKTEQNAVNDRLIKMTPPHEVHRLVRPLKSEKAKWKASEWRSWLLFYAIPCLTGILNPYALQHFALFVRSINTLLQTSITEEELNRTETDLHEFVIIFELLYGEKHVTFNVHSLKHLVRCVRFCGPLWATSTFPFESTIRTLKRHVHGPKGVYEQMAKKSILNNVFHAIVLQFETSPAVLTFYKSLFARMEVASFRRSGESVVLIGKGEEHVIKDTERNETVQITEYQRCIYKHMIIHTVAYNRPQRTNDTSFISKHGKFLIVHNLFYSNGEAFAHVLYLKLTQVTLRCNENDKNRQKCLNIDDVVMDHLYQIWPYNTSNKMIIPVTDIVDKCVVIDIGNERYLAKLPNMIEIQ